MSDRETLLKNVEETAEAMRVLNMLTQPIFQEINRREAELCDEKLIGRCDLDDFKDSSVVISSPLKLTDPAPNVPKSSHSSFDEESSTLAANPGLCKTKSVWSPVKHVKVVDAESVLKAEKTPVWKPLRKSKARQSLSYNLENLKSPTVNEMSTNSPKVSNFTSKSGAEFRTPLKPMISVHSNQTPLKAFDESDSHSSLKESSTSNHETEALCADPKSDISDSSANNAPSDKIKTDISEEQEFVLLNKLQEQSSSVDLISTQGDAADNDDLLSLKTPTSHLKSIRSPVRCSPVLLQAYGEDVANVRGCIGSPEKVVNLNECGTSVDPTKVLKGVNAYVEVRRGEDDRTGGFRWKLKQLGASISDTLNKKVTHVVFQEGLLSTFRKAKQLNICLVSAQWVMACDESYTKVPVENYPIEKLDQYELADPLTKYIRRPKVMSPDLGSGRDEKRLSRRFQRIHRKSMLVLSPLAKTEKETVDNKSDENLVTQLKSPLLSCSELLKIDDDKNHDDDDDDDGFLAMLEAQVKEKAASRLKKEEAEKAVKEFKSQLQALLGQKSGSAVERESSAVPLAKIFQPNKMPLSGESKRTRKTKSKQTSEGSISSSSFMRNWLKNQKSSFESSVKGGSKFAPEAAVDALSDKIVNSMIAEPLSSSKTDACNVHHSLKTPTRKPSGSLNETPALETPPPSIAKIKSKSSQSTAKRLSKSKQSLQESKASSGLMQNWLSKAKLTPKVAKHSLVSQSSVEKGGSPMKKSKKSPNKYSASKFCDKVDEFYSYSDKEPLVPTTSFDNVVQQYSTEDCLSSTKSNAPDEPEQKRSKYSKCGKKNSSDSKILKRKKAADSIGTPQKKQVLS